MSTEVNDVPFISNDFVIKHLPTAELFKALEELFVSASDPRDDSTCKSSRSIIDVNKHDGYLLVMPAYAPSRDVMSVKILRRYQNNVAQGLPNHFATLTLFDARNGVTKAVFDAEYLTIARTSTATAVATKYLVAPDAKILAIIGAGGQAEGHIEAFKKLEMFSEIRIYSRTEAKRKLLAAKTGSIDCSTVQEAVKDADVVVTVTNSKEPIVSKAMLRTNALLNVVGACNAGFREVFDELMETSQLIADSRELADIIAGDFVATGAKTHHELGEIISGKAMPDFSKIRLFKSQGLAVADTIAADILYDKFCLLKED